MSEIPRTILVIDDEKFLLTTASRILKHLGHTVFTAIDGESALAFYELPGQHFDIVLLDINMPGMGSRDIVTNIERRDPTTRLILTSGRYHHEGLMDLIEAREFLPKPYTLHELRDLIR